MHYQELAMTDVLVIGGGPAGSTIAALLAEQGKSVILIDKDQHPRFHIGESLLPFNVPLLDQLGVLAQVEQIGMPKFGIEFVSPDHERPSFLEFSSGWHKDMSYSFQVRRSEFDHILLKNAAAKGANVIESTRVTAVDFPSEGGVIATVAGLAGEVAQHRARFVVDASGRDSFLAGQMKVKRRNPRHASAAIFGHFTDADRLPSRQAGHISIFWFAHGWFWFIPLLDGTTSVGAVCAPAIVKNRQGDVTALFRTLIESCPALAARLKKAVLIGEATGTGNYSYSTTQSSSARYLMIGDAAGFIDPVFSTGVYLAMRGAVKAASVVSTCLEDPAQAQQVLRRFEQNSRKEIERFSWFIYRMTSPEIRNLFMAPRNYFRIEEAILALLSGDIGAESPIRFRLLLFKMLYYAKTALSFISRHRARSVQPVATPSQ